MLHACRSVRRQTEDVRSPDEYALGAERKGLDDVDPRANDEVEELMPCW